MRVVKSYTVLFLFIAARLAAADSFVADIADDSSLRAEFAKTLFIDPPGGVVREKPRRLRLDSGEQVEVRVERAQDGSFSIVIAREYEGSFPGWAQGSFILTRGPDGKANRARIFLRSDPYTYVQFRPLGAGKSEMDAVVYEALLVQSLPVPFSFDRLIAAPLGDVLETVERRFPRRYFDPEPSNYRGIRAMIGQIRKGIRPLVFADDGAFNEQGNYVFINDGRPQTGSAPGLNCSGFAKWVVDGLLRPVTGERLTIAPLKAPYGGRGTNFTDPFERLRDPFFGLDWTRNLAAAANTTFRSEAFSALPEFEIRKAPFAALLVRQGRGSYVKTFPEHLPNAGFSFEGIRPLLYALAIDEPGNLYLGAISREGGTPPLRTYFHVVVLAPYFDENKVFHVAIFESAEETSFARFRNRYPSHHINLCRIPIETAFTP